MVVFNCPSCNLEIKVPDQAAGRVGTCPRCHVKVRVPGQEFALDPVPTPPPPVAPTPTVPATSTPAAPVAQIPCPSCGEMIAAQAKKCRFCGEGLAPAQIPCPSCGEMISSKANQCRFCGEPLGQPRAVARRQAPPPRYDDEDDYAPARRPRTRDTGRYPPATRGTGRYPPAPRGRSAPRDEKTEWEKGFGDYVKTCFSKYADFNGRATRKEYWFIILFIVIVYFGLCFLVGFALGASGNADEERIDETVETIIGLLALVFFLPVLSLGWRRCHDVNWSGAAALLGLVFPIFWVIVGCISGTPGANQYGQDPYDPDDDDYDDYDDRRPRSRRRR